MLIMHQDSMHKERINVIGIGKVIKCTTSMTKTNQLMWRCFMNFDYEYKKDKQIKERCINVVAFEPLSQDLIAWEKNAILMVVGSVQKSTYNGKEYFQIIPQEVHEQPHYSEAAGGVGGEENDGDEEGYASGSFDPGF